MSLVRVKGSSKRTKVPRILTIKEFNLIREDHLIPAGIAAGIGRVGWHTFRHTYSCLLREHEVDLKVQQALMRHADIRTTMNIYTQAIPRAVREANRRVVRSIMGKKAALRRH